MKCKVRLHIKPANSFAHAEEILRHILHRNAPVPFLVYIESSGAPQSSIFPTATNSSAHSDESLENPLAAAPVEFAVAVDTVTVAVLPPLPPPNVAVDDGNVVSKLSELPSPVVCATPPVGRLVNDEVAAPPISVAPPTVCVPPSPVQDSPMGQQPAMPLSPMAQDSSEGQ